MEETEVHLCRRSFVNPTVLVWLVVLTAIHALPSSVAQGASVVLDVPGTQAIFSQTSFGSTPIEIRFDASRVIVAPKLLVIKNEVDLRALYALAPDPAPIVDAFFVNTLDACAHVEPSVNGIFAGCAQLPGHIFVEETDSSFNLSSL
jgi:hypothetical protein